MIRIVITLLFGFWLYHAMFGGWSETIGLGVVIVILDANTKGRGK